VARPLPLAAALSATRWEADKVQATLGAPDVDVVPIVALCGAPVPFGQASVHGVPVVAAASLPGMLRNLPPVLAPERGLGRCHGALAAAPRCLTAAL
jgi:hypothetical protein